MYSARKPLDESPAQPVYSPLVGDRVRILACDGEIHHGLEGLVASVDGRWCCVVDDSRRGSVCVAATKVEPLKSPVEAPRAEERAPDPLPRYHQMNPCGRCCWPEDCADGCIKPDRADYCGSEFAGSVCELVRGHKGQQHSCEGGYDAKTWPVEQPCSLHSDRPGRVFCTVAEHQGTGRDCVGMAFDRAGIRPAADYGAAPPAAEPRVFTRGDVKRATEELWVSFYGFGDTRDIELANVNPRELAKFRKHLVVALSSIGNVEGAE